MKVRQKQTFQYDPAFLAEIYDAYQRPLYRFIFRQVNDVETARDLTADVFQRLLQAVQKENAPNQNIKAWLYCTAHHIVVDHYRRQQFRDHDPLLIDLPAGALDPSQAADIQVKIDAVRAAFSSLTLEQRQVINLRFLEGLPTADVAAIMKKSTGAVKSLQFRALTALRHEIKRQEVAQQEVSPSPPASEITNEKGMDSSESIPSVYRPLLNSSTR